MNTKTKLKMSKRAIFPIFVGLTLLVSVFTSNALTYHFEETFSDPNTDVWNFQGSDWSEALTVNDVVKITPTASISDGSLLFGGNVDNNRLNGISKQDDTVFGAWSLDVYQPSNALVHSQTGRIWGFLISSKPMGVGDGDTHWADHAINVFYHGLRLRVFNGTSSIMKNQAVNMPDQKLDQFQHYDFIRAERNFYIFLENDMILNTTLSSTIGSGSSYLTIVASQGSGVRIDNIQITTNYEAKLSEVLSHSLTTPEIPLLYLGIGGFVAVAGVSLFSYQYYKKKGLRAFNSIISNGQHPEIARTISETFDGRKSLYLMLLGYKTQDMEVLDPSIDVLLSEGMQQYRHLLNPFRMTIMNILYQKNIIASADLKHQLEISWTDFYNNIKALEKHQVVEVLEDFDEDGLKKQFVIITDRGEDQYVHFIELIGKYVDIAKEVIPSSNQGDLYPS